MDIRNCWLQIARRILKCPTHDTVRSILEDVDLARNGCDRTPLLFASKLLLVLRLHVEHNK